MSRREGLLSAATTLGVLVQGVLPGVVLAVVLSLFWLLATEMRPKEPCWACRGSSYHSVADCPEAEIVPGLLVYRFSANLVFFNIDYFCERGLGLTQRTQFVAGCFGEILQRVDADAALDQLV